MAGDCAHIKAHYAETVCRSKHRRNVDEDRARWTESVGSSTGRGSPTRFSPNFEVIDGLLYRKKLERGFINYREVLDEDRRHEAISTFHRRRPGQHHLSLEETYKCVAENYWWDGMYFQIRDFVQGCTECQSQFSKKTQETGGKGCVTKTIVSHSAEVLRKLRSQREAGMFCDITLRTNGQSYSAHRAVLAAVSDHFQEIFTEMDSSMKADIDLTGFSEESLLSLLNFSYSSTLCVRREDLPEVLTMARHLGMWPAVEACSALIKEQEQNISHCRDLTLAQTDVRHKHYCQHRESRRKKGLELETSILGDFSLTLDDTDESLTESPSHNLRRVTKPGGQNGLPLSPSNRMKLMDFKCPSSKKGIAPRNAIANPQSPSYSPISTSHTRLLRSTPGAAQKVQRLLPMPESPRRKPKSKPVSRNSCTSRSRPGGVCSSARVKQEVEEVAEDEEDYARAQEKYKLMNVLGLQRTALLPRPDDLIGWRQKKRLRKLKANNYSLTKRRKPRSTSPALPYGAVTLSLPLTNPVNSLLLNKSLRAKLGGPLDTQKVTQKRKKTAAQRVPPSDRCMRSEVVLPDLFQASSRSGYGGRELRRSVRRNDTVHLPQQRPSRRNANKNVVRKTVRIKAEPIEYSVTAPRLPSNRCQSHTAHRSTSSQRKQAKNNSTVETVRTLRYNSSRPALKNKLRQGSAKEARQTKCKHKEQGRKELREVVDTMQKVKVNEAHGLHLSEHDPLQSIYDHPLYKVIKEEPADPVPVGGPYPDPPSPDLGKRQSKPPIKLLDSGFLFSFCRPAGPPIAGLKKEEESVDICLTRSVSQVGDAFAVGESNQRILRARVPPPTMPVVKREREERSVSQNRVQRNITLHLTKSRGVKAKQPIPKLQGNHLPVSSRSCMVLDSVRRARLKQLRGPRSQAPKVPKVAHACLECSATYKDCDALIMHRLRHIEGKHWPCPLCSKTFFRLRNVRNHIRTHDPKLYKCKSCIVAGS